MKDEDLSRDELLAELCQAREALARLQLLARSSAPGSDEGGLVEERDQLFGLIEHSSEAIAIATPEGVCSYVNPAGLHMLGVQSLEEVAGRPIQELHPDEVRETVRREVLPAVRSGRWQGELAYQSRKNGGRVPCWVNAFAIRHSHSGELIGLAMLAHDITAQKSGERHRERIIALNDVSRRLATSLLEYDDLHRAVGIILEGAGRILEVGRSILCRFRDERTRIFRTHEWTGGEVARLRHDSEPADDHGWFCERLVRGEVIRVENIARMDPSPLREGALLRDVVALLLLPVVINGRLEAFFGFADEKDARAWEEEEVSTLQIIVDSFARAVERRIAERERMMIARDLEHSVARERQANRYKSEFLASMSHELRTPMNAIVGYAELLCRPNVDPEKQGLWLGAIKRSTQHLLSLVNDVLDLSKIEAGQMSVQRRTCRPAEMISDVEDLLRGNAEEKLLELRVVYERPVPEVIETDEIRFKQILINLVGNAIKFTAQGSVTIRVDLRRSRSDPAAKELLVSVEDTGVGIPADQIERLFRPFYQVQTEVDRSVRGTGLGLDISRHLARLLGGGIEVQSELGKGSTFTFHLTLQGEEGAKLSMPGPEDEPPKISLEEPFLRGRRILIVDDNADNREVLHFLLSEAGCACECAENGALGVRAGAEAHARGAPFDAVLMDMNMPVMDGYRATEELRERGVPSPVIALTALATKDDEQRCRRAGCIDYVTKPVVPSAFFETILRHVRPADEAPVEEAMEETRGFSLLAHPRFQPLIRRYVESFPEQVAALREHWGAGRIEDVRTLTHRLRGTAANYGFPQITEAAGRCEDAIRSGQPSARVAEELERLTALLVDIRGT